MSRRCPHCGGSLVAAYPAGAMQMQAYKPTLQEQADLALYMRANPPTPKRQQVQPACRDGETLLGRTPTHFIYQRFDSEGRKVARTELIEDARRNPARIRSVNA